MDRPLKEHIAELETRLEQLTRDMMAEQDKDRRNRIEAMIRATSLAIGRYREAYEIEQYLRSSQV